MPAAPAGYGAIALPPETVTPGHSSAEAQVATSPILRSWTRFRAMPNYAQIIPFYGGRQQRALIGSWACYALVTGYEQV
jgi:hypothetical protein